MLFIIRAKDVESARKRSQMEHRECEPYNYVWHVGEDVPRMVDEHSFEDVCEIQADGHELEYIRQNFKNLPDAPNCRIVQWKGEMAQFIYDHLRR